MGRFAIAVLAVCALANTGARAAEPAGSDPHAEIQKEMCQLTKCQHNVRITLRRQDGGTYDRTFDVLPGVVQSIGLSVVAGQTIHVEAEIEGDKLVNLVAVDAVVRPERTITAKLEQMDDGGMMLTVTNPFDRPLKFNMGIMPLDQEELYKTTSCPVMAKGGAYELWPYPIFQILLGNGRLLQRSTRMTCDE